MIFLDSITASNEFNTTDYFTNMDKKELELRIALIHNYYPKYSSINNIRTLYSHLVKNFTTIEIMAIKYYHTIITYNFKQKLPLLCPNVENIKYIKMSENIDWNYPYTINYCVVLPEPFIKTLVEHYRTIVQNKQPISWNYVKPNYKQIDKLATVICHEWIHIVQRTSKSLIPQLENIYTNIWKFDKNYKLNIGNNSNKYIFITNPDGKNGTWSIILNEKRYFPLILYNTETNQTFDAMLDIQSNELIDFPNDYLIKFGGIKDNLYHPNEIFADLVSQYIMLNRVYVATWENSEFYKKLNDFMCTSDNLPYSKKFNNNYQIPNLF